MQKSKTDPNSPNVALYWPVLFNDPFKCVGHVYRYFLLAYPLDAYTY